MTAEAIMAKRWFDEHATLKCCIVGADRVTPGTCMENRKATAIAKKLRSYVFSDPKIECPESCQNWKEEKVDLSVSRRFGRVVKYKHNLEKQLEIVKMFKECDDSLEVAKAFDMNQGTVAHILNRHGAYENHKRLVQQVQGVEQ